jgi:nucleoside-diphosphate-sugar epimerase
MTRCLVLGANGFIGRHVVEALLEAGHTVRVYERRPALGLPSTVEIRQGLLEDAELLSEAVGRVIRPRSKRISLLTYMPIY